MKSKKSSKYWNNVQTYSKRKAFSTPQKMWEAAVDYFEWVEAHPLMESKLVVCKGVPVIKEVPVMRVMTLPQLCFHLGVSHAYFRVFKAMQKDNKDAEEYLAVVERIENVIREQKFQGAAANLLNANIIARDLGLVERTDIKSGDEPIQQPVIQCITSTPALSGSEKEVEQKITKPR